MNTTTTQTLDNSAMLAGLVAAYATIRLLRTDIAGGPTTFWRLLDHALDHLDAQINVFVRGDL
jgi:hypothetical protein